MVIAQTEVFANHQADLIARGNDFGAELLRKVLPACLFQAADYVQAQRERRRMLVEIAPFYDKFDVLVTAASGPAPRLDQFQGIEFWSKPSIYNIFNITGGPALALCIGFGESRLPIGMQIASAPGRDATVLAVAHAYEKTTAWRTQRPFLQTGPPPVPVEPPHEPALTQLDERTAQTVESLVCRAGIELDARGHSMLMSAAPHALAMVSRIRRDHPRTLEPASLFDFPR